MLSVVRLAALCAALLLPEGARGGQDITPTDHDVPHLGARTLRNGGYVIAAPGVLLGATAAGLGMYVAATPCRHSDCMDLAFMTVGAEVAMVLAVPLLATGIPMVVVGERQLRENRRHTEASLGLVPTLGGGMATLQVRF